MIEDRPRAKRKPWVIFITDNRELGRAIRILARPTEGRWTNSRRRARKFRTEQEAREAIKAIQKHGGETYLVAQL